MQGTDPFSRRGSLAGAQHTSLHHLAPCHRCAWRCRTPTRRLRCPARRACWRARWASTCLLTWRARSAWWWRRRGRHQRRCSSCWRRPLGRRRRPSEGDLLSSLPSRGGPRTAPVQQQRPLRMFFPVCPGFCVPENFVSVHRCFLLLCWRRRGARRSQLTRPCNEPITFSRGRWNSSASPSWQQGAGAWLALLLGPGSWRAGAGRRRWHPLMRVLRVSSSWARQMSALAARCHCQVRLQFGCASDLAGLPTPPA